MDNNLDALLIAGTICVLLFERATRFSTGVIAGLLLPPVAAVIIAGIDFAFSRDFAGEVQQLIGYAPNIVVAMGVAALLSVPVIMLNRWRVEKRDQDKPVEV